MTRCDDHAATASTGTVKSATKGTGSPDEAPCECEACRTGGLPLNPFVALRVAYGMLLGEEDFRVLMGNPRGKQMLHNSWLHGSGVVWGYAVERHGAWELEIRPGLAIDGIGRELVHEATTCLDVRKFAESTRPKDDKACTSWTTTACLVAEFDACLSNPVPTLADPCDVTRKHDDYSRVIERVRFDLVPGCCPAPCMPYHRVRVLLGLDSVWTTDSDVDERGEEAMEARRIVAAAPPAERPHALLCQFRRMAALDAIDRQPADEDGDCYPTMFPMSEDDAGVALACVDIHVRDRDGCLEVEIVEVDPTVRSALLPTSTIQELTCGLAPALIGDEGSADAGGPRVIGPEIALRYGGKQLVIPVTAPLARGTVEGAVAITTLSPRGGGRWVAEDSDDSDYDESLGAIVVKLADRPVRDLVRVVVRGAGPKPVMGVDGVPLAGLVGGPPGTKHNGHDAVWTFANAGSGPPEPAASTPSPAEDGEDHHEEGR